MAQLKLYETIQTKLPTLSQTDGQLIVVRDNASLYVDLDGNRVYISDWIDVPTDTDRLAMLTPLSNKYYYVVETNKIWRYISGNWVQVTLHNASEVLYDNTTSGLSATNVASAIDEISESVDDLETSVDEINDKLNKTMLTKYTTFSLSGGVGWYRIALMNNLNFAGALGEYCHGCKLRIRKFKPSNRSAENHLIDFMPIDNNAIFENEVSTGEVMAITKIRYCHTPVPDGYSGSVTSYIDIYYNDTYPCSGVITISEHLNPTQNIEWQLLGGSTTSPLSESTPWTVLKEYDFHTNTNVVGRLDDIEEYVANIETEIESINENIITINEDITVINDELIDIREDMIHIKDTTESPILDSHNGVLKINEIGGKMEQESTEGKNLIPISEYTTNTSGDTTKYMDIPMLEQGKSYIVSAKTLDGSAVTSGNCQLLWYDADGNIIFSSVSAWFTSGFAFNSDLSNATKFAIYTASTIAGKTIQIQLEEDTVATPYEKFTGGQPAPNPSYPMEIKKSVVSGVKTYGGENLHDGTLYGGYYSTANFDLSLANVAVYKSIKLYLKKGTHTLLTAKKINLNRLIVDGELIEDPAQDIQRYTFATYTDGYVGISFRDATSSTTEWDETTFIGVFKTSSITFSQPIDLYGMGDVQDVITAKPIKRRYGVAVFDGSDDEGWKCETATERMITNLLASKIKKPLNNGAKIKLLCSHFLNVTANATYLKKVGVSVQSDSGTVHAYLGNDMTLAEWKAHLQSKPMEVVYELAEEVIEPLPIVDQIALNSLATYDGITYVEFIYEGLEPTFKAEYPTSKENSYIIESLLNTRNNALKQDMMNERISALEAKMANI